jgi:hypothetical protein
MALSCSFTAACLFVLNNAIHVSLAQSTIEQWASAYTHTFYVPVFSSSRFDPLLVYHQKLSSYALLSNNQQLNHRYGSSTTCSTTDCGAECCQRYQKILQHVPSSSKPSSKRPSECLKHVLSERSTTSLTAPSQICELDVSSDVQNAHETSANFWQYATQQIPVKLAVRR